KHVVKLRANLELDVMFTVDGKDTSEAERFRGLPLPAVIVEIWRRCSELTSRRIDPRVRIQNKILCRVDAMAVRVFHEQGLARDSVEESGPTAAVGGIV